MKSRSTAGVRPRTSGCAIGVDVGGTKIAAGLVLLPQGEVQARQQIPTAPARGGEAVFAEVRRLCEELVAKAKAQNETIDCIGVGVCELVDFEGNVLSENCIAWKGRPVQADLNELAPAVVEADVRAAALAEATVGAGKAFQQFLYITVGTGISCCLVLDGRPFTGAHSATGTMASSPMSVPCEQCGHVSHRTLEEIASGLGLVTRYNQRRPAQAETGQTILAAAAAGDPVAADVVRCGGETLGASVGLLISVLDPEAVIVGGGLGLSEGLFWESFVISTRRHIWSDVHRQLPVIRAQTGRDAGLIGAALAAWQKRHPPPPRRIGT
jgi:glucokinase